MKLEDKILTSVVAGVAAFLVSKALDSLWTSVTGELPPDDDDDDVWRLALFTGISAVAATVARRFAMRGAGRYIASRSAGQ